VIVTRRYRLYAVSSLLLVGLIAAWISNLGYLRENFREGAFDILLPWLVGTLQEPALIVVDIDRETLARYGSWPWPRSRLAELVDAVSRAKPVAVGLDILFAGTSRPNRGAISNQAPAASERMQGGGDAALAAGASSVPTVLGFVLDDEEPDSTLPNPPLLLRGRPRLPEIWTSRYVIGPSPTIAAAAAGFGALVLLPDADGRIRRVPLLVNAGGVLRPGIAVELLRVGLGASGLVVDEAPPALYIGPLAVPLGADAQFRTVPTSAAFRARRTISAAAVMSNPAARARLAGQVVLIGSGAPEVGGLRVSAASAASPSVQIQADAVEMLLRGPRPQTPAYARPTEAGAAVVLAVVTAALTLSLRPLSAALITLAATLAWVAGSAALFGMQGILLDPAGPVTVAIASFGVFSLAAYADNEQRARALRQQFEQHLSPTVVRRLLENPDLVRLEGESREITVLFTDIEGFLSLAERSEPRKLVALLDEYLDEITRVVLLHGGMVEKIVGDGVHAMFNAPLDLPEHPRHAFECALAIMAISEDLRIRPLAKELGLGRTRIGLETGVAIVGDVGGRRKLDYTAHGTTVNMAARLEAANKELGTSICIGPKAAARLDPRSIRSLGLLTVRGLSAPVEVFTVAGDRKSS
jgi:adenylate cyclase